MLNAEQAKELRQSALFKALCSEIEGRIYAIKSKMETCRPDELAGLQAEIKVYRGVQQIPQDVLDKND